MRVCFLTLMPSPYIQDLFQAVEDDGRMRPCVLYLEMAAPGTHWERAQLPDYAKVLPGFGVRLLGGRVQVNWTAARAIAAEKPDVVVVCGYAGVAMQRVMLWLHRRRIPWIFWGEMPGMRRRWGLGAVLRWFAQRAATRWPNAIAAVGSRAVAAYRERSAGRCPVVNIPYCCNMEPFLAIARGPCRGPRVRFLYCGQLIPRKGVDLLIEAFCRAAQSCPQIALTLAGEGPLRPTLEARIPAHLRKRVRFAGFQQIAALPALFAAADVFVLPSRHDGWGVVVNQAIAAGMPVLCSDAVGAGYDLVVESENGHQFPADDADSLRRTIEGMAASPERIFPLGQRSRALAADWTPARSVDCWYELCSRVRAGSP